jgi:hypothetical protein
MFYVEDADSAYVIDGVRPATPEDIPDEMVERAAKALLGPSWRDEREKWPIAWENAKTQARIALAAALSDKPRET